jgi:large subunit ribosomal protein L14
MKHNGGSEKKYMCMIQVGTQLHASDNSGARIVQCVKVLRNQKNNMGRVASLIVVSVKTLVRKQKSKVKKGHLYKAIVCETKKHTCRVDGSNVSCSRNTAILLSLQMAPIGSRIQGITPYELRVKGRTKLLSLSLANV